MSDDPGRNLTLQQLPELRRRTESVAKLLKEQLTNHLETLRPLFAPERVFGKYAGGKVDLKGVELALSELKQAYRPYTARPFDLPSTFDPNWLPLVGTALEAHPWEYAVPIGGQTIAMSSPVKWVLGYRSAPSPAQVKALLASGDLGRRDDLRQTVVNALVLQVLLQRTPGIEALFRDLRFEIAQENLPDLPGFPVTTVTSCLRSFRPADALVTAATAFSGVPSFIELLDLDSLSQPRDPLREKLLELTK